MMARCANTVIERKVQIDLQVHQLGPAHKSDQSELDAANHEAFSKTYQLLAQPRQATKQF